MILVAGGTGALGTRAVPLLTARGHRVRILTRNPDRARHLEGEHSEVICGDVRSTADVLQAVEGVQAVVSAVHGFQGTGNVSPRTVDYEGNRNLIRAAEGAGVEHFILISMQGARPDHPLELLRMKYRAEGELRASRLAWTIIRPTVAMELWATILGEPLVKTGKTRIFGRGVNPINFVSWDDVARFIELAVVDPALRGAIVEVGGPENLTVRQFVDTFVRVTGSPGPISAVPLPLMRVMARVMRPIRPAIARQIEAGIIMDTENMAFDAGDTVRRYPSIQPTTLAEVVTRQYAGRNPVGVVPAV